MPLFQASTVFEQFTHEGLVFNDVVVHWYRTMPRTGSPTPASLVDAGAVTDADQRSYAERFASELFTEDEVAQLERYLSGQAPPEGTRLDDPEAPLRVRPVVLPIREAVMGYQDLPTGGFATRFALHQHDGFDLPFEVHGFFDLTTDSYRENLDRSVAYVHRALQMMGIDAGVERERIEEAARKLFRRDRLFVVQEKTHQDWLSKIQF